MPAEIRHVYRAETAEARRNIRAFRDEAVGAFKAFGAGSKVAADGFTRTSASARTASSSVQAALSKAGGLSVASFKQQQASIMGAIGLMKDAGQKGNDVYKRLLVQAGQLSTAAKASGHAMSAAFVSTAEAGMRVKAAFDAETLAAKRAAEAARDLGRAHAAALNENRQRDAAANRLPRLGPADFLARGAAAGAGFLGAQVGITGVASLITEATQAVVGFDTAMANVKKTVGLTTEQAAPLRAELLKLSTEIPHSADKLGQIAAMAGQFGVHKEDIAGFTRTIADLSVAVDGLSAEQAAAGLAKIRTITNSTIPEMERMASVLVRLGNEGNSTEGEILELTKRIASAGTVAGLTKAELFGFGAAMANAGIEAEAGGTAFSKTLRDISAAVAKGKEGVAGFAKVAGVSAEEFAQAFKTRPAQAIQMFIEGLDRVRKSGQDVGTVLGDLDIKESRQIDTLQRLALNTASVADQLKIANNEFATGNALQAEAAAKAQSIAGQWQIVKNIFSLVAVEIGNHVTPVFLELFKQFQEFAKTNEFKTQMRDAAIALGELVKALAAGIGFIVEHREAILLMGVAYQGLKLAEALGGLTKFGAALASYTPLATSAATATGPQGFAGALGLIATPAGMALAAVTLLTGGIIAYNNAQGRAVTLENERGKQTKEFALALKFAAEETGKEVSQLRTEFESLDQMRAAGDAGFSAIGRGVKRAREEMERQAIPQIDMRGQGPQRVTSGPSPFGGGNSGGDEDAYGIKRAANDAKRFGYESEQALQAWARAGTDEDIERIQKRIIKLGNSMHDAGQQGSAAFEEAFASIQGSNLSDLVDKASLSVSKDLEKGLREHFKSPLPEVIREGLKDLRDFAVSDAEAFKLLGLPDPAVFKQHGKDLAKALSIIPEQGALASEAMRNLTPQIVEYVEQAHRAGQSVPEDLEAIFNAEKAREFGVTVAGVLQGLATGATSLKSVLGGIDNDLLGGLLGGGKGMSKGGLLGGLLGDGGPLGGLFKGSGIAKLFGGEGLASNLGSKLAGGLFGAGTKAAGALSGIFTAGIGTAISMAAPAILGGIKKLFSGTPEWQKLGKAAGKAYGVSISDEMAHQLRQRQKDLGVSRGLGVALGLPEVAAQAEITGANLVKFTAQFDVLLKAAASGGKGAAEALKAAGAGFDVLVSKAREAGATGTAAFGQLVAGAKAAGLEQFKVFAGQQVGAAGGFFSTILENARIGKGGEGLSSLGGLGAGLLGSLKGLPGAGAIIDGLSGGLDKIAAAAKKAWVALPEGIAGLIGERDFRKANADLFATNEALAGFTQSLGEAGFIAAPTLSAIGQQIRDVQAGFMAAGKSQEESLVMIAPTLQAIADEHARNGTAIDAETQSLIDQAAGFGLVKAEGAGLINTLQQGFNAIIAQLGGDPIFGKLTAQAQAATESAAAGINSLGSTAQAQAQAVGTGVAGIANSVAASAGAAAGRAMSIIEQLRASGDTEWSLSDVLERVREQKRGAPRETHAGGGLVGPGGGVVGEGEFVFTREATAAQGPGNLAKQMRGGGPTNNVTINVMLPPGTPADHVREIQRLLDTQLTIPQHRVRS